MSLTAAQKTTLKTNIAANTNNVSIDYGDVRGLITDQIKNWDPANDGLIAQVIANWYNGFPGVDFFANYGTVPISVIRSQITWKNLTPLDGVPTAAVPSVPTEGEKYAMSQWQARSFACQGMQFNLQMLLTPTSNVNGTQVLDVTRKDVWQGLQDSLTNVPSDAAGALQTAGWTLVRPILNRKATNLEKLFADISQGANFDGSTNAKAAFMVVEGAIDGATLGDAVRVG